jgi:hypothetical protein
MEVLHLWVEFAAVEKTISYLDKVSADSIPNLATRCQIIQEKFFPIL